MPVGQDFSHIPIIDVRDLIEGRSSRTQQRAVAAQIGAACRESGFFYVVGHGVDQGLQQRLRDSSQRFFAQDVAMKMRIRMALGGPAWRGYFRVGDELTSGKPDQKEGLYFGAELAADHPLVKAGTPLHGPNLFPAELPEFRSTVLEYMAAMTRLGHRLVTGIALSLGLEASHFADRYTAAPLVLFRIFNYPPAHDAGLWGVGEHTDYGLLTILLQDEAGGLEVRSPSGWVAAPPVAGSFVCNIGDMLDRMTRGLYRSTPHRVRNLSSRDRLSFPFFFDPNFFAQVEPIELPEQTAPPDDAAERWDHASVHAFEGTYGDYLLEKVGKVFPQLRSSVL
ncbi:MAG TPA: 2-oxoglutarate and iron-dependent oxygenase domain-containing protein [Burkholderiaceae bacterium]|nr:2-oxoglutarate and iron-dependent oxygenase domain-containing protein [Burkholderiaceae bacterium]